MQTKYLMIYAHDHRACTHLQTEKRGDACEEISPILEKEKEKECNHFFFYIIEYLIMKENI